MKQREFVYLVCNFYSPGPPAAARVNDYLGVCLFSLFSHFYLVFLGIQKHYIFLFFIFILFVSDMSIKFVHHDFLALFCSVCGPIIAHLSILGERYLLCGSA